MRKLLFILLLCGPTAAVWSQSRPVVPTTLVVETKELMALQDSVRLHRMARREAEHQRDSLLTLVAQWRAAQTANAAPLAIERVAEYPAAEPTQPAAEEVPATQQPNPTPPTTSAYWVVVGGSPNAVEAAQMAKSYSRPPFQAVVVQAPSGFHRVCWGPFTDEKTALDVLRDARQIRPDAWYWHQLE
jgi:hypothetical protein